MTAAEVKMWVRKMGVLEEEEEQCKGPGVGVHLKCLWSSKGVKWGQRDDEAR